jgi:hypothetical protein
MWWFADQIPPILWEDFDWQYKILAEMTLMYRVHIAISMTVQVRQIAIPTESKVVCG